MELPDDFIHQATRYMLGRMSYAVGTHCDWLITNWQRIPLTERVIIRNDIEEAFARDDISRKGGGNYHPLGMDMDRAQWERVRNIWLLNETQLNVPRPVNDGHGDDDEGCPSCDD